MLCYMHRLRIGLGLGLCMLELEPPPVAPPFIRVRESTEDTSVATTVSVSHCRLFSIGIFLKFTFCVMCR